MSCHAEHDAMQCHTSENITKRELILVISLEYESLIQMYSGFG